MLFSSCVYIVLTGELSARDDTRVWRKVYGVRIQSEWDQVRTCVESVCQKLSLLWRRGPSRHSKFSKLFTI